MLKLGEAKKGQEEEAWKVQLLLNTWPLEVRVPKAQKDTGGGGSEKNLLKTQLRTIKTNIQTHTHDLQILQWMILTTSTLMVDIDDIAEFDENIDDNADWGIPLASLLDL